MDSKLTEGAEAPDLVAALPVEGLKPQSVKYLKGLLGLNNIYPFYTARGLAFAEAVKGDYNDGAFLIVLDYGSAEARVKAWAELETFLQGGDRFKKAEVRRPGLAPLSRRERPLCRLRGDGEPPHRRRRAGPGRSGRSGVSGRPLAPSAGGRRRSYWKTCLTMSTRPRAYSISASGIFLDWASLVKRPSLLLSLVTTR